MREEAARHYERAIALRPDFAIALGNLGSVHRLCRYSSPLALPPTPSISLTVHRDPTWCTLPPTHPEP